MTTYTTQKQIRAAEKQTPKYMQHTVNFVNDDYCYTFENGIELWKNTLNINNIGFPVKHPGDVFCLLRAGEIECAEDLPKNLRNW